VEELTGKVTFVGRLGRHLER